MTLKLEVDINDIRRALGRTDLPLNDVICGIIEKVPACVYTRRSPEQVCGYGQRDYPVPKNSTQLSIAIPGPMDDVFDISQIAGNASDDIKRIIGNPGVFFQSVRAEDVGSSMIFGRSIIIQYKVVVTEWNFEQVNAWHYWKRGR